LIYYVKKNLATPTTSTQQKLFFNEEFPSCTAVTMKAVSKIIGKFAKIGKLIKIAAWPQLSPGPNLRLRFTTKQLIA
jgi:hypothetical protein